MNDQERVNILLVDDQPSKLLSYEVVLADLRENLIKANSAREALEALLRHDIAVILVDVCMPDLDGFELASMIREHPRFRKTAMIFVSAVQITDLDRLKGYEVGAVDYVPVPVVPAVLQAKVRVFVELYRKTRQLERINEELEQRVAQRTAALEATALQLHRLNEDLEHRIEERTRERERALEQLFAAQKMDTIGQLTGNVAHDFNNLLMAVLSSLRLLKKRLPDDPRMVTLLDNAVQGAERGAALTRRLLAFARRQELKPESIDVAKLVADIEDLLQRALGSVVRIDKRIPSSLASVSIDSNQLELALLNLAVNARDAMPQGGVFTIEADNQACLAANPPGNRPADLKPGNYIRIRVSDTGVGMDAATLARAPEPFFTTKGLGKGTGLGLSMIHGLAAQSGGALRLSSELGRGTSVELWLPQSETTNIYQLPHAPEGAVPPVGDAQSYTVLVVDDDVLVSTGTAAMLEDLGHTVIEAYSGEQALEVLSSDRRIDIVLTDHAMPGMTGTELARRIKQHHPHIEIALASGFAEIPAEEGPALDLPRLSKPFSQEELAALIREIGPGRHKARFAPIDLHKAI